MPSPSPPPPSLIIRPLTTPSDLAPTLRLIPDSLAQNHQLAARAILLHPSTLTALLPILLALLLLDTPHLPADPGTRIIFATAACAVVLLLARRLAAGYIVEAEAFRVGDYTVVEGGDFVVGAKLGDVWIGVIAVRMVTTDLEEQGKKKQKIGVVRAWTTKLRYRRRGLGGDLVREAWAEMRRRGGEGLVWGEGKDSAYGARVLPEMYAGVFRERERAARRLFEGVVRDLEKEK